MSEGMIWGVVGVAVTLVVGVPIAVIIARRYSTAVVLRRAVSFERLNVLAERLGGGLTLTFRGRELDSVSRTYLALWHERGGALRGSEILASDPLRIEVADGDEILQARVLSQSKELIEFRCEPVSGVQQLQFEYLDKHDGGVVEVLHTGSEAATVAGTIPGATIKKPRKAILDTSPRSGELKPHRWWRPTDARTRARTAALILAVVSTIYVIGTAIAAAIVLLRSPRLIEAEGYDLTTLQGQDSFAQAVTREGAISVWIVVGFTLLALVMSLFAAFLWVRFFRLGRGVPKAILETSVSATDPSSLQDVRRLLESGTSDRVSDASGEFKRSMIEAWVKHRLENPPGGRNDSIPG